MADLLLEGTAATSFSEQLLSSLEDNLSSALYPLAWGDGRELMLQQDLSLSGSLAGSAERKRRNSVSEREGDWGVLSPCGGATSH